MALFCSVFRIFERFAHVLRRETRAQCAAQELAAEKLPEECEAFDYTASDKKCRKRHRKVPEKYPLREREEEREVKINKGGHRKDEAEITLSPEKIKKRGCVHQKKREMHSLEKLMEGGSELREAGEKKRKKRKRKQRKVTEPAPLLVEVKPLPTTIRSSYLKPIGGELPMLPSVSGHLALPAAHFKPLPPVTKPVHPQNPDPASDELFFIRQSSSQVRHPKRLPPSPTPAPDEVVALGRPPSRKPQPFPSSLFEPPPELMLIDIEDEENEYVEYTGKTFQASDLLKSERPQTPEAEIKTRRMLAWLEVDEDKDEVQEEGWSMEVVRAFEEEEYDPSEMGDCEAIEGPSDDDSDISEFMMKLFCEASPDGPKNETQNNVNAQTKSERKVPFFLFTWAEKKAKKMKEKKIIKEKERRERELLLDRYMNDPKLKHLWINKHNRNYNS